MEDGAEDVKSVRACSPAAFAALPDAAILDLRRRFRLLEQLFRVPPAVNLLPRPPRDARPGWRSWRRGAPRPAFS
eukprot:14175150-Alexandrium_andersonii.AAC.1